MQTECLEARVSASLLLHPRVGVVVPKHGRNIVDRNRTKRRLRELVRLRLLPVIGRVDLLCEPSLKPTDRLLMNLPHKWILSPAGQLESQHTDHAVGFRSSDSRLPAGNLANLSSQLPLLSNVFGLCA